MLTVFYDVLIYPIELLVSYIYIFTYSFSDSHGIAIVGISMAITILSFPLYNIAEKIQQSEREVKKRLQSGVDRIKTGFSGDEQYMILSTYYRQHNYHPAYALRSSVSLLIQVPFFIAAYNFLNNLASLQGVSFLFIADLSNPDGLLTIGGYTLNLLPIAMTLINVVAGLIYTKGFLAREKAQLFGMALLFLILLYTSPAGLVLYWTLNNIFSLVKNIIFKLKRPALVLYLLTFISVFFGTVVLFVLFEGITRFKAVLVFTVGIFLVCMPLELKVANWTFRTFLTPLMRDSKQRKRLFIATALWLWVLCGFFIPSTLISSSPLEFAFTGMVENPLIYIVKTAVVFLGIAVVWPLTIYAMASVSAKTFLETCLALFSMTALINATVFQGNYGTLNNLLVIDDATVLLVGKEMMILPIVVTILLSVCLLLLVRKGKAKWLSDFILILAFTSFVLSIFNMWAINREFKAHKQNMLANQASLGFSDTEPIYHLSKEGKNVIVFFLDRAVSAYFPYILDEIPALQDQLQGFTYYPNTVSYGPNTLLGAPALMGGYEYTPEAINKRSRQTLVEKHNESLLLMPRLFSEAGYNITVSDPPWSNYKWSGDYTPFDQYPEMNVFSIEGKNTNRYISDYYRDLSVDDHSTHIKEILPRFVLFKIAYPLLRYRLYRQGSYCSRIGNEKENNEDLLPFLSAYANLYYLPELTDYDGEGNTFTFIDNETPHRLINLDPLSFEPKIGTSNSIAPMGVEQELSQFDIQSYQVNAASMKRIGIWLEKLQQSGVYDNTRIIIVADHGSWSFHPIFAKFNDTRDMYGAYNPLLLVKDFNVTGPIRIDADFMTNADTPLFAIKDLEIPPINPYTENNLFDQVNKNQVNVFDGGWGPKEHPSHIFVFDYAESYTIKEDISVESNWRPYKAT